jgi:hypothetical protein
VQCHGEDNNMHSCGIAELACGTMRSWHMLSVNQTAEQQIAGMLSAR